MENPARRSELFSFRKILILSKITGSERGIWASMPNGDSMFMVFRTCAMVSQLQLVDYTGGSSGSTQQGFRGNYFGMILGCPAGT